MEQLIGIDYESSVNSDIQQRGLRDMGSSHKINNTGQQQAVLNTDHTIQQAARKKQPRKSLKERVYETYEKYEEKLVDYENIILLITAGWLISLMLSRRDESKCLDDPFYGPGTQTFRKWLDSNFSSSISTFTNLFLIIVQNVLIGQGPEKAGRILFLTTMISNLFAKLILEITGLIYFLNYVNFEDCSDSVISYCSAEFLVFISAAVFFVFKVFFNRINWIARKCEKWGEKINPQSQNMSQGQKKNENQVMNQLAQNEEQNSKKEPKKSVSLNEKVLKWIDKSKQGLKKQIIFYGIIGWVFSLVLTKKDKSSCLNQPLSALDITYRQWLFGDGISSLICLGTFTIYAIAVRCSERGKENLTSLMSLEIGSEVVKGNIIANAIFFLSVLGKIFWLFVGLILFTSYLDIYTPEEQSADGPQRKCSGFTVDYLMMYFMWFIYFLAMIFLIAIKHIKTTYCK